jgi:hypothetical protein
MTMIAVMIAATIALGTSAALLAARYTRGTQEVIDALAARGTAVGQISRRTKMPQDVVMMHLRGRNRSLMPRQNVPIAEGAADGLNAPYLSAVELGEAKSMIPNGLRRASRGIDVAQG